ncbi:SPOR domain-containing protein [Neptunomonas concharum]|uniref:SPOR domain-containing protein n=1 Tax=Neptunomonas concharum TaxID=1031538 RepID=A0A5P1RBI3_9GAMM|nr:SPOR domain-containing protein [Neptunomonas concharum]QEQ96963.1 SPOR domain-containing protein [Neptunomonas concharum]
MHSQLKRRLIGSAVLLLAAIVFLPFFLTGEGYRERQLESRIPAPPPLSAPIEIKQETSVLPDTSEYPPVQVEPKSEPEAVVVKVEVESTEEVQEALEEKRPVIGVENKRPELDEQNVPVAWTLQLASFKDEANARALRKQLMDSGHKVYTRKTADLFKVYVGPDLQKARLESLKEGLKNDFGLDGIIVRFTTQ